MRPADSVAVAILFFERAAQTLECIRSFLPAGIPIYVLNNGSSPGQARILEMPARAWPAVTILKAPRNLGVAAGRNLLIRHTRERWLFFVDNDITVATRRWLPLFRAHRAAHPRAEVFVPSVFNVHDGGWVRAPKASLARGVLSVVPAGRGAPTNCFPGGASLVRRSLFERLGLFDEAMFVGFEDWELAVRALVRGAPIRARPIDEIQLIHAHRPAAVAGDRVAARVRYDPRRIARSHLRLMTRHGITFPSDWPVWAARQRAIAGVR